MPKAEPPKKRCTGLCGKVKAISEFALYHDKRVKLGKRRAQCRDCMRTKDRARKSNPKLINYRLMRSFGITFQQYQTMLAQQNQVCAICQKADAKRMLSVDHDHATGEIRGLLCNDCNRSIGMLGDTAESLKRAVDYLLQKAA